MLKEPEMPIKNLFFLKSVGAQLASDLSLPLVPLGLSSHANLVYGRSGHRRPYRATIYTAASEMHLQLSDTKTMKT